MANNPFLHEQVYRGQEKLAEAYDYPILIAGCGAIGSNLAESLVRHGFRNLTLLDMDRVEAHNISTQTYSLNEVGAMKVSALAQRLYDISEVECSGIMKELTAKNIGKLLKPFSNGLVIDCFDNRESRALLTKNATHPGLGYACLHGGLFEDYGEVYWNHDYVVPNDAADDALDVCDYPLARNIIMLTVTAMSEEVINFILFDTPVFRSFNITLKDMSITKA